MEFRPFYFYTNRVTYFNDFTSKDVEYELVIQQITQQSDSGIHLQAGFTSSHNGACEVSFDTRDNRVTHSTCFHPPRENISSIHVILHVERVLIEHYIQYHAGMYLFLAVNDKLCKIYQRIVKKHFVSGHTLGSVFNPTGGNMSYERRDAIYDKNSKSLYKKQWINWVRECEKSERQ